MDLGFFNKYPYTDFHELNLDWVINALKAYARELEEFVQINAIKYADPIQWDIMRQYEKNTVVIDPLSGTAYISVQAVPAGVSLARPEYWTVIFDLSRFITAANNNFTVRVETTTTTTATFNTAAGEWLIWDQKLYKANVNITTGDAYIEGGNITRWMVEEGLQDTNTALVALAAIVGNLADLTTTDKTSIVNAINDVVSALTVAVNNIGDPANLTTTDKSSLVNAINELVTDIAGITSDIGDLTNLTTIDQSSIVNAINELVNNIANLVTDMGTLANLTTTDKSSIVNAINELVTAISSIAGDIGDLSNLTTVDQSSLVNAINELVTNQGDLSNLATADKSNLVAAINEIFNGGSLGLDFVTPEDYGAAGDGVTDDTAAVQAAFDTDKNVIMSGRYLITSDLTIIHDTTISEDLRQIIAGGILIMNGVTLKGNAQYCGAVFYNVMFTSTVHSYNPAVLLNRNLTRTKFYLCKFKDIDYPIMGASAASDFNQETELIDCHFQTGETAITIKYASYALRIENCNFNNFSDYAIKFDNTSNIKNATIKGCVLERNGTAITFGHDVHGCVIDSCYFESNTVAIDLSYLETDTTGSTYDMVIRDCYFDITGDTSYVQLPRYIQNRIMDYLTERAIPITFDNWSGHGDSGSHLFHVTGTPSAYSLDIRFKGRKQEDLDDTYFRQYEVHEKAIFKTFTSAISTGGTETLLSYADLLTEMGRTARPDHRGYAVRATNAPFSVYEDTATGNIKGYFPAGLTANSTISFILIYK